MKKTLIVLSTAVLVFAGRMYAAEEDNGTQIIVEAGTVATFGNFTYGDSTITIKQELFNPRLSAELRFGGTPFAAGIEYASSENTFDGEYEDSDGTLDMERTEMVGFARLGSKNHTNLRLGYRRFEYDISNATINQRDNGAITELDRNGEATGDLTTGIDAELNLACGDKFQCALGLGYTYFMDAKYDWEYDAISGSSPGHKIGTATVDAHSIRVRPEFSMEAMDGLRVFINYTLAATAWVGDLPEDSTEYPGYDIMSGVGLGVRYTFGL